MRLLRFAVAAAEVALAVGVVLVVVGAAVVDEGLYFARWMIDEGEPAPWADEP